MRAFPAAVLSIVIGAVVCGPGVAQILPPAAPPQGAPPAVAPAPPPTVLLPPSASDTAPASDEAPARPKEPAKPVRRTSAILQALDKTTAETLRFEAPIGQPIRYKDLIFVVHACEDAAPDPRSRHPAHAPAVPRLDVRQRPRPAPLGAPCVRRLADRLPRDGAGGSRRRAAGLTLSADLDAGSGSGAAAGPGVQVSR